MLQPAADGLKLFFKENVAPAERDKLLYLVGPSLAGGAALLAYAVIPWGTNNWFGHEFHWDIAHINVGLLFILGITSLGVYSLFLGGFASNSKYSLLGGLRSSAQLISYEMAVSFALIGVVILSGSLDLENIVGSQQGSGSSCCSRSRSSCTSPPRSPRPTVCPSTFRKRRRS